jgi:TRAP transporter TAXI family solute receptor
VFVAIWQGNFSLKPKTRRYKMARKVFLVCVVIGLMFASSVQAAEVISIGTAPAGGAWYASGGALADIITNHVEGVKASAQVTGAAVANMKLLGTKKVQMAFTINTIAKQAYDGRRPFKKKYTNIRAMLSSFAKGHLHIFTLAGSDLNYVSQIKGRTVVPGPPGHGSLIRLREIFKGLGFTFDDIKAVYLPYNQALQALGDRKVDAVVLYIPPPVPIAKQFALTNDIKLLRLKEDEIDAIRAKYPHYERLVIAKHSYKGQEQDVPTVGTPNGIYVDADLNEQLVYRIVKATFENIDKLRASHPSVKNFSVEMAPKGSLVPFHPGAIRYYKEVGVWPGK